jgi:hypothetical protein
MQCCSRLLSFRFFTAGINGKYRIKGYQHNSINLKGIIRTVESITASGSAKLAALGYDIIYRDAVMLSVFIVQRIHVLSIHLFVLMKPSVMVNTIIQLMQNQRWLA